MSSCISQSLSMLFSFSLDFVVCVGLMGCRWDKLIAAFYDPRTDLFDTTKVRTHTTAYIHTYTHTLAYVHTDTLIAMLLCVRKCCCWWRFVLSRADSGRVRLHQVRRAAQPRFRHRCVRARVFWLLLLLALTRPNTPSTINQHNHTPTQTQPLETDVRALYRLVNMISDFVIPQEYGVLRMDKLSVGSRIVRPLLKRINSCVMVLCLCWVWSVLFGVCLSMRFTNFALLCARSPSYTPTHNDTNTVLFPFSPLLHEQAIWRRVSNRARPTA